MKALQVEPLPGPGAHAVGEQPQDLRLAYLVRERKPRECGEHGRLLASCLLVHRHDASQVAARRVDVQLTERQPDVDLDAQRAQPHEVVDDFARARRIVGQSGREHQLLVVEGNAFIRGRVVVVTPHRSRMPPGQSELLIVRALVHDARSGIVGVRRVEIRHLAEEGGHVADAVLVDPLRAGQVIGDAEPAQRGQVVGQRQVTVVATRCSGHELRNPNERSSTISMVLLCIARDEEPVGCGNHRATRRGPRHGIRVRHHRRDGLAWRHGLSGARPARTGRFRGLDLGSTRNRARGRPTVAALLSGHPTGHANAERGAWTPAQPEAGAGPRVGEGAIVIARLLSCLRWLVPGPDRAAWQREWVAEFECAERDRRRAGLPSSAAWRVRRAWAACRHAWWLRGNSLHLGTLQQVGQHGLRACTIARASRWRR